MLGNVNYMDGMMYNVWIQVQYALWVIEKWNKRSHKTQAKGCKRTEEKANNLNMIMSSYQMVKESTQLGKGKNQDLQRSKPNTMRDQHHEERKKDSADDSYTMSNKMS